MRPSSESFWGEEVGATESVSRIDWGASLGSCEVRFKPAVDLEAVPFQDHPCMLA